MDRRQFLTRSAALVAISALPLPQAQAAVQPQLASGVIQGLTFHIKEPIRLILDGPLTFFDCRFVFDNSGLEGTGKWHGVKFTPYPEDDDAMLVIANPQDYDVDMDYCHIDTRGMRTKGAAMFFAATSPIRLKTPLLDARAALAVWDKS